jgi:broad specificity phosphatase PhoE
MTNIILVRHGQASFGSQNYDQLSELGARQSRLLGEHWARLQWSFDAVYAGDMSRQQDTARHVLVGLQQPAMPVQVLHWFNEYEFEAIMRAYLPQIAQEKPALGLQHGGLYKNPKLFQAAFELAIAKWLSEHPHAHAPFESWRDFCGRCVAGLDEIAAAGHERVVVFTSGGVIAVALRMALGLSDATTFRQNWRIYNGSVHTFRKGRSGLTLLGFNNIAHLELSGQKELITFR